MASVLFLGLSVQSTMPVMWLHGLDFALASASGLYSILPSLFLDSPQDAEIVKTKKAISNILIFIGLYFILSCRMELSYEPI